MNKPYILHYAPDNASLIFRIALEILGAPYEAVLVDRSVAAQQAPAYLSLNPLGMIPALETPDGVIFETGAILLWLADRHAGIFPVSDDAARGEGLKWLFFISNSLHAGLRQMFYPEKFIAAEHAAKLPDGIAQRSQSDFAQIEYLIVDPEMTLLGGATPTILDIYACTCLRWAQLYPTTYADNWVDVETFPALRALAKRIELLQSVQAVQVAEGLGPTPFSNPIYANPPVGSAT